MVLGRQQFLALSEMGWTMFQSSIRRGWSWGFCCGRSGHTGHKSVSILYPSRMVLGLYWNAKETQLDKFQSSIRRGWSWGGIHGKGKEVKFPGFNPLSVEDGHGALTTKRLCVLLVRFQSSIRRGWSWGNKKKGWPDEAYWFQSSIRRGWSWGPGGYLFWTNLLNTVAILYPSRMVLGLRRRDGIATKGSYNVAILYPSRMVLGPWK